MTGYLTNLADVLRGAGCSVAELPGWQSAAFPAWGAFRYPGTPSHVMCHHTASNPGTDPAGDLHYITVTNTLRPICNLYLSRTGTFHVVAAGRVCTNGAGSSAPWSGGVPNDMMNHYAISIEAANSGRGEPWPKVQTDAYVAGVAALCAAYGIPTRHVRAHFEWAPTRKIDPAGESPWATGAAKWDMDAFRASVAAHTPTPSGDDMQPVNPPQRMLDTRETGGPLAAGETRRVAVMYGGSAVALNVTVIPLAGPGFLTVYKGDIAAVPNTSNLNWSGNDGPVSNGVFTGIDGGWANFHASAPCHLIVDLQGAQ